MPAKTWPTSWRSSPSSTLRLCTPPNDTRSVMPAGPARAAGLTDSFNPRSQVHYVVCCILDCVQPGQCAPFVSGPFPARLDPAGDGAGSGPRKTVAGPRRRARPRPGRGRLAANRHRTLLDDVPGVGQGPLRDRRPARPRYAAPGYVTRAQLDHRPASHVRAGVGFPARHAGVPEWPHPHRPGPLHRDGAHLELARLRLERARRSARGAQLSLPDPDLLGARLALPDGGARLVRVSRRGT